MPGRVSTNHSSQRHLIQLTFFAYSRWQGGMATPACGTTVRRTPESIIIRHAYAAQRGHISSTNTGSEQNAMVALCYSIVEEHRAHRISCRTRSPRRADLPNMECSSAVRVIGNDAERSKPRKFVPVCPFQQYFGIKKCQ